jgi:hypothetical protein
VVIIRRSEAPERQVERRQTTKEDSSPRPVTCPECGGEGGVQVSVTRSEHSPSCNGYNCSEWCPVPVGDFEVEPCEVCGGTGKIPSPPPAAEKEEKKMSMTYGEIAERAGEGPCLRCVGKAVVGADELLPPPPPPTPPGRMSDERLELLARTRVIDPFGAKAELLAECRRAREAEIAVVGEAIDLSDQLVSCHAEIAALRRVFHDYCQHHADCYFSISRDRDEDAEPCSCGFEAAARIAELEGKNV